LLRGLPRLIFRGPGALFDFTRQSVIAGRIREGFAERGFVAGDDLATALELLTALEKPLLIEGPAGVGKTESAKVLADVLGTRLIRLQCYEGLDAANALYEWNYPKQMLRIRLTENCGQSPETREAQIFSEAFLLRRPLLEAITQQRAPVLLIDEIDRADEAFEAFLLELLGEFQVTIPELGTITAKSRPAVILTSNRTRELSDALRRRCLYLWLDYPGRDQEVAILRARLPDIDARLAEQIAAFMEFLREQPFRKVPGVAESLDWALALTRLHREALDEQTLEKTLGCILKVQEDWALLRTQASRFVPLLSSAAAAQSAQVPKESDFGLGSVQARRG
jgi:MoxR-like ATPase